MNDKNMKVLTNVIGAVESGGQIYGNRRYEAYAGRIPIPTRRLPVH